MAGYSQTPLIKKLGIKAGFTLYVKNPPVDYERLVGVLPEGTQIKSALVSGLDFIHCFTNSRRELEKFLIKARERISLNGMIWVSWPKKAAKIQTDVTEDVIREICLPLGLVDVKVCAVDAVWSGLKLVIRREQR